MRKKKMKALRKKLALLESKSQHEYKLADKYEERGYKTSEKAWRVRQQLFELEKLPPKPRSYPSPERVLGHGKGTF